MCANHAYLPHFATTRYRALAIVVVLHLALGWWLLRGIAPTEQPTRQPRPAPVLIQHIKIASPAQPPPPPPSVQQPQVRQPQAVQRQPVRTAPARAAPRPVPVLRPAASVVREARPEAVVKPPPPPAAPTPMASPVLPSREPAPAAPAAELSNTSKPVTPAVLMPSAAAPAAAAPAAAGLARPGPPAPTQPQANATTGLTSSTGAAPADIALVCPIQVAPAMPRLASRKGITGVVQAQALIVQGVVREVRILSGPPVFHQAVRSAMLQYRCVSNRAEVLVTQEFVFQFQ